ncbi:MAG: hypothetical protein L6Q38_14725, partial [Nitrospira sp.]|nr:hypothetical protein [Nitrospira sp.]
FNPFSEAHLGRGPGFTPARHQAHLARDLANLPQFLCRQDDVVLVPFRPSVEHLSRLKSAGFPLPEFVELEAKDGLENRGDIESTPDTTAIAGLAQRRLGHLRPWAWGPDAVRRFQPLFAAVTGTNQSPDRCFPPDMASAYSKAWSADVLRDFLTNQVPPMPGTDQPWGSQSWLCPISDVGVAAKTLDEVMSAVAAIRGRGHHRVVVKEAFGLAGHNAVRLWEPEMLPHQQQWIRSAIATGNPVVVEPWMERVTDFSVQYEMTETGLRLVGFSGLVNDRRGQFLANWAAPDFSRRPPSHVATCLATSGEGAHRLTELFETLRGFLETRLQRVGFLGPVGIDAFVYRTPDGRCRLKPVVEINPRYTMGRLSLELMKRVCPGSFGAFEILSLRTVRGLGWPDFPAFAHHLEERHPVRTEGEPTPRLREGSVCLNDPTQAQACLAVWHVARRREALACVGHSMGSGSP